MQVESAHARHVVALSTRTMRSNKIEFLPVEDEFKRKIKDKEIRLYRTPGELAKRFCREQTRKKERKR